jgi:hypothetical protein
MRYTPIPATVKMMGAVMIVVPIRFEIRVKIKIRRMKIAMGPIFLYPVQNFK